MTTGSKSTTPCILPEKALALIDFNGQPNAEVQIVAIDDGKTQLSLSPDYQTRIATSELTAAGWSPKVGSYLIVQRSSGQITGMVSPAVPETKAPNSGTLRSFGGF